MRAPSLVPVALIVLVAGCGSAPEESGHAATVPPRDLTLQQAPAPALEVASPVEAPRPQRPRRSPRPAPIRARAPEPAPPEASPRTEAPVVVPAPAHPPASVASASRASDDAPADPRSLEPGETVTIIPTSSGPSVAADPPDEAPSRAGRAIMIGGGHGGTCQPRGAMRSVAARPAPGPRDR